jgi:hypothetical protein
MLYTKRIWVYKMIHQIFVSLWKETAHRIPSLLGAFALTMEGPFQFLQILSPCPPVSAYQRVSHRTNFGEMNYWELLRYSVEKRHIWLKFDNSVRQLTWRPKTIDSDTKQFENGSSAKGTYSSVSKIKPSVLLFNSCMRVYCNAKNGTQCCLSMATLFTLTRHNFKFYVHCLFFIFKYLSFITSNRFVKYDIILQ